MSELLDIFEQDLHSSKVRYKDSILKEYGCIGVIYIPPRLDIKMPDKTSLLALCAIYIPPRLDIKPLMILEQLTSRTIYIPPRLDIKG